MVVSTFLASTLLVASGFAQNANNKNALFPNGLSFDEQGLFNNLPPSQSVWPPNQWAWGTLPKFCYRSAISDIFPVHHCNPYDIEVYDIKFPDCSNTWTLCRCHNSTWPLDKFVDIIGRIPIKSRQFTRTFAQHALVPANEGTTPWAYAYGPDISIFDSPSLGGLRPTLVLHENAHTVDYGRGNLNSNSGYVNAIRADSCVADPYARSNDVENYAQLSVLGFYDLNPGPLSRYGNPQCLQNQLNWIKSSSAREGLTPIPGGTCTFIWPKEERVCMGPAAGCGAAGATVSSVQSLEAPEEGIEIGQITEEPVPIVDYVDEVSDGVVHNVESRMRKRKFD